MFNYEWVVKHLIKHITNFIYNILPIGGLPMTIHLLWSILDDRSSPPPFLSSAPGFTPWDPLRNGSHELGSWDGLPQRAVALRLRRRNPAEPAQQKGASGHIQGTFPGKFMGKSYYRYNQIQMKEQNDVYIYIYFLDRQTYRKLSG